MRKRQSVMLAAGTVIGLGIFSAGLFQYWSRGFSTNLWMYWLLGCAVLLAVAFRIPMVRAEKKRVATGRARQKDVLAVLLLAVVFLPLYTARVHEFPRQMNTDEIAIMATAKTLATLPGVDIYAPSYYSDLPGFIFWLFGELGMLLGGVTLENMRLLHALSGVCIIILTYILLRLLRLPGYEAVAGAAAIGLNHSLFFLSRMAMRDNTALLFSLLVFVCLLHGWQKKSYGWTLLGGFFGGLTFYTYYPSRITLVVWLVFVTVAALVIKSVSLKQAGRFAGIALIGTLLIAAPLAIATSKHTPVDPYTTQQYLWLNAAREQERMQRGTATQAEAVKQNILYGLTTFNQSHFDRGGIYTHFGYGFVDTLTGILLWVGVAVVVVQAVIRRRMDEPDVFVLTGFLVIWLSLAFLLTKAPDYTRLLMVLPFVAYLMVRILPILAATKLRFLKGTSAQLLPVAGAVLIVVCIAGMNLRIAQHFYKIGETNGDSVGDTLRFQEEHAGQPVLWTLVPGIAQPYYYWGDEGAWRFWLHFGKTEGQDISVVKSQEVAGNASLHPGPGRTGYILTTGETWTSIEQKFRSEWNVLIVKWLDPAGNRVAVSYK